MYRYNGILCYVLFILDLFYILLSSLKIYILYIQLLVYPRLKNKAVELKAKVVACENTIMETYQQGIANSFGKEFLF